MLTGSLIARLHDHFSAQGPHVRVPVDVILPRLAVPPPLHIIVATILPLNPFRVAAPPTRRATLRILRLHSLAVAVDPGNFPDVAAAVSDDVLLPDALACCLGARTVTFPVVVVGPLWIHSPDDFAARVFVDYSDDVAVAIAVSDLAFDAVFPVVIVGATDFLVVRIGPVARPTDDDIGIVPTPRPVIVVLDQRSAPIVWPACRRNVSVDLGHLAVKRAGGWAVGWGVRIKGRNRTSNSLDNLLCSVYPTVALASPAARRQEWSVLGLCGALHVRQEPEK